jgi:MYXO-CTERM domain-containing protein
MPLNCRIAALSVVAASCFASASTPTVVREINPGTDSSSDESAPAPFAVLDGVAYFRANDGTSGFELWRSDGTAAGTYLVKDIRVGMGWGFPTNIAVVNGKLFFNAFDSTNGTGSQVWTSDGTAAGTIKLGDTYPTLPASPFSDLPTGFTALNNNTVVFTAPSTNGVELYKTDGTPGSVTLVKDIHPGATDSYPTGLTKFGNKLYFTADEEYELIDGFAVFNRELYATDGTAAGTSRVADINPGIAPSRPSQYTPLGDWLYFTATTEAHGVELFSTDGTAAGTTLAVDLNPGGDGSGPQNLRTYNGRLLFTAYTPASGEELFSSDGTAAGTRLVRDINPGGDSFANGFVDFQGKVYFQATSDALGSELWTSDGTEAGTSLVVDLFAGADGSAPSSLTAVGDRLFFVTVLTDFDTFMVTTQLWMTDGTAAGTELVYTEPGQSWGYSINNLTALNDTTLLFNAPTAVDADGMSINSELLSVTVPEPGGFAVLGVATLGLTRRRRRRA